MMKQPMFSRDHRQDRQTATSEKTELDKSLDSAIDRSLTNIQKRLNTLLRDKSKETDPNA